MARVRVAEVVARADRDVLAIDIRQLRGLPIERSLEDALGTSSTDPMLSQLKAEYRSEFATALREAIGELSAEDRTLLRQSTVEQLSIDAIGPRSACIVRPQRGGCSAHAALVAGTRNVLSQRSG